MRLSLSTNWCNTRIASGEEIADKAQELGFSELELGYNTTLEQVAGFRRRADAIRVGSVHAFCPVPISAPRGYPELYSLASFDAEARRMASLQVRRNIAFAADMGADTVVLHAGRVLCPAPLQSWRRWRRRRRGAKMLELFRRELDALLPALTESRVTLALENLPYFEGFPDDEEMAALRAAYADGPIRAWFDTGHHRVQACNRWILESSPQPLPLGDYAGMHLNDVRDVNDDHFAPGFGKVDFAALKPLAEKVGHVVFEPNSGVGELALRQGIAHIRKIWKI